MPKFGLIFRRGLQIELCQALKHSAFFSFRWKLFGALPKVGPRRTAGNKTIWPKHLENPRHVKGRQLCHTRSEPPSATDLHRLTSAPEASQSSPPCAVPRRASADLVAERCDAAMCPELGEKRKCAACAQNTLMTPTQPSSVGSYLGPSLASCFLISGLSYKTTFKSELRISSFPLYSI